MATFDRPISAVLHDIVSNVQDIVRSEVRLARTEVTEELGKASSASILVGAAALMLAFSMVFALLAIFFALSAVMPQWAAALIVGVGEGAIAAILLGIGIKRFKAVRATPETLSTLQENVQWPKQPTR
jgi:uncharacterized membrane protein YqjE